LDKKSRKGRQELEWAYAENGMRHQKLKIHVKTRFASKAIMFEKAWSLRMPLFSIIVGINLWLYNIGF
jgi:hypothetical protein